MKNINNVNKLINRVDSTKFQCSKCGKFFNKNEVEITKSGIFCNKFDCYLGLKDALKDKEKNEN